jgi:hypothetical protein
MGFLISRGTRHTKRVPAAVTSAAMGVGEILVLRQARDEDLPDWSGSASLAERPVSRPVRPHAEPVEGRGRPAGFNPPSA